MKIGVTFDVRLEQVSEPVFDQSVACLTDVAAEPLDLHAEARDDQEEFDSPETIHALAEVLESLGHEVELLGNGEPMLRRLLSGPLPDLVLNIAEGHGSSRCREARTPAVLEMLGIPYTGSDPLTLSVTLDKDCAKRLVAAGGVATPAWALFEGDLEAIDERLERLPLPVIVKPAYEGSSKGIVSTSVIDDRQQLREALDRLYQVYRQPVLVEEFIDGDELTVGLVGNEPPTPLGIMRVVPQRASERFVYSLEVKRDWRRQVCYECPARISAEDADRVLQSALLAWRALGCRDVARIDFRLRDGIPYFLEANPLPGLSPTSGDLVLLAGSLGIDHAELITRILHAALERLERFSGAPSHSSAR